MSRAQRRAASRRRAAAEVFTKLDDGGDGLITEERLIDMPRVRQLGGSGEVLASGTWGSRGPWARLIWLSGYVGDPDLVSH